VCVLHAQQADEFGDVQYLGSPFFDAMLAQASRKVIVSVDRIVSAATVRKSNHLTKLPSALVDFVVEAPFGAHPKSSPALYSSDKQHLEEYVKASRDDESFDRYLARYMRPDRHAAYLDAVGGSRLADLGVSQTNARAKSRNQC
jgi:glutaconate CoA-transferase subunit A